MLRMRKVRVLAAALLMCALTIPGVAGAAKAPKVLSDGNFAALQSGKQVYVYSGEAPLFQTKGKDRVGDLIDLFVLPYGPAQVPMVLIRNEKNGYMVFSDLWPEFAKGKEKDTVDAYYSGRVLPYAKDKIVSRTGHHYAEQIGEEIVVYTANDFSDIKKGFHESIRVKGKLHGLILYDCCPYVVVDDGGGKSNLSIYHAGEKGPELAASIGF